MRPHPSLRSGLFDPGSTQDKPEWLHNERWTSCSPLSLPLSVYPSRSTLRPSVVASNRAGSRPVGSGTAHGVNGGGHEVGKAAHGVGETAHKVGVASYGVGVAAHAADSMTNTEFMTNADSLTCADPTCADSLACTDSLISTQSMMCHYLCRRHTFRRI